MDNQNKDGDSDSESYGLKVVKNDTVFIVTNSSEQICHIFTLK